MPETENDEMQFEDLNDNVAYLLQAAWFSEDGDENREKYTNKDADKLCGVDDVLLNLIDGLFWYVEENKGVALQNRDKFIALTEAQRKAGSKKDSFDIF